jgi:hypothetical protein
VGINLGELLIFESGITNMLPSNMAGNSPLIIVNDVDVPSYKPQLIGPFLASYV